MNSLINIRIAETKEDKDIANKIVIDFHSYVNTPRVVGRCIKYIISYEDKDVATFWLGSGFKPTPKAILNFFEKSQKEFDKIFNEVADNKRFCIKENPISNFGSQILSMIRKRAKKDWFTRYGNNLIGILTTIGDGKNGAVYLADNWKNIGKTAGLPKRNKSVSMKWNNSEEIKEILVTIKL
jgi:hypothetical protein